MEVVLKNVRIAFPNLYEAQGVNGGKPNYGASFILDPEHDAIPQLEKAMQDLAKDKWKDKAPAAYKSMKATDKLCLHDGDTKAQYAGYEGNMYLSANRRETDGPVAVFDRRGNLLPTNDGTVYAGCYVNAKVELWTQDNQYGKRINASLITVQFVKDGDAFGGKVRSASANEFEDLGEDEDAGFEDVELA